MVNENERVLKLTHSEIERIENALYYVYERKLEIISSNGKLLTEATQLSLVATANPYASLAADIKAGEKDI